MQRLDLLVVQSRPSHQITLHQACNALGVFKVRVVNDLHNAKASLAQAPDAVLIDHGMPTLAVQALLKSIVRQGQVRAVLFIGAPPAGAPNLSVEAWRRGLWVVANLSWPLSMPALHAALLRLRPAIGGLQTRDIQTVTSSLHAR